MMKVALIGYGYWGINLAKTISKNKNYELTCIYDNDMERVSEAKKLYDFKVCKTLEEILKSEVEAVFIATPPSSHHNIAIMALEAKKHIFVEKPFTLSLDSSLEVISLAEKLNLKFMVDHVFIYSEPVKYLKKNIEKFGDIVYINARRINLGLFQHSTDVIWDLAVHDLSIIDYLVGLDIKRVSVFKKHYQDFPNEAIANIDLELISGIVINLSVSWLSPVKVREMIIGGTKMSAVYDDTISQKIKIFDGGVFLNKILNKNELYEQMIQYKFAEESTPIIAKNMSLDNAVIHFYEAITQNFEPITGKKSIYNVMKALEIISKV